MVDRRVFGVWVLSAVVAVAAPARAAGQDPKTVRPDEPPLLVVMAPTGTEREGVPVYRRHPNGETYMAVLSQGFAGRMVRLYRLVQQFLAARDGAAIEPAYLLMSGNEGGFPRYGFWLQDESKPGVGYVDLHARLDGSGRFGALDQIFPHELMHVIVHQLSGPPAAGLSGSNQIHAIGVRTDRVTAFDEGFAEHAQVMAVDDPDAQPRTAAMRSNMALRRNAEDRMNRYRRALDARWALAPPARLSFVTWFSQTEQALRYHAVKANLFAHEPAIRLPRSTADGLFAAYLLENILPGSADGPVKSTPRLFATEGVVSSLFSRWVTNPAMQRPVAEPSFYARFGIRPEGGEPLQHAYLKLFAVFADARPHDAAGVVRAYIAAFPEETDAVAALLRQTGFVWPLPNPPEIWLANDAFMTGTTMFDQYRALPRVHTFDLNAASMVDLLTVDGMSMPLAMAIQRGGPYASLDDLARTPGVTAALVERLRAMHASMRAVRAANEQQDIERLELARLLRPVIVRMAVWVIVCAMAAGVCYGLARWLRPWRLALNGLAAALLGFLPACLLGSALQYGDRAVDPTVIVLLPMLICGVPAGIWQLAGRRLPRDAGRVLAAWALACLPALVLTMAVG